MKSSQSVPTEDSFGAAEFLDPEQPAAPQAVLLAQSPQSPQSPQRKQPWKLQCRGDIEVGGGAGHGHLNLGQFHNEHNEHITTEPCSPKPWEQWFIYREIIPFYGRRIQVSEI